jgi:hypothetical protein
MVADTVKTEAVLELREVFKLGAKLLDDTAGASSRLDWVCNAYSPELVVESVLIDDTSGRGTLMAVANRTTSVGTVATGQTVV